MSFDVLIDIVAIMGCAAIVLLTTLPERRVAVKRKRTRRLQLH